MGTAFLRKMSIPAEEYNKEGVEGLFFLSGWELGKDKRGVVHSPRAKLTWLIDPCSRFSNTNL